MGDSYHSIAAMSRRDRANTQISCNVHTGSADAKHERLLIRDQLLTSLRTAIAAAGLPLPTELSLEVPRERAHGDFAANVALQLAKRAARKPRDVAEAIAAQLSEADVPHLDHVEIAGPGFLNIHLRPTWLHEVLRDVVAAGGAYGTYQSLAGQRINLEFVSANPTGPLHAGGGRWVAVGDAIANLLASQGAEVSREYYLNDTGNQLNTLRASLSARYHGRRAPDDGYQGDYLGEIAEALRAEHGDDLDDDALCELGVARIIDEVRADLARIGVHFDTWFSERMLHERGDVDDVLGPARQGPHLRQVRRQARADIEWLRTTDFGDTRDRVLRNVATGATTYLCNDLAYHRDKLRRGFDHLIDIWGADHQGQVKSMQAGMQALTRSRGRTRGPARPVGEALRRRPEDGQSAEMRMSKRAGTFVSLADILDQVDGDVTRMTFLLQSIDSHAHVRPRDRDRAVDGEPRLLRADGPRAASRRSSARRPTRGSSRRRSRPSTSACSSTTTSSNCCACSRVIPTALADAAAARAPAEDRPLGARLRRRVPRLLPRLSGDRRRAAASRVPGSGWRRPAAIGLANALGILGVRRPSRWP